MILITVGILVALAIGNWAEEKEFEKYEILMLNQILTSLTESRATIDTFLLPRLSRKEEAIANLLRLSATNTEVTDDVIMQSIENMNSDFFFTYNSGAYEALKSSGIDKLSDPQLRSELITFYDAFLPTWKEFIDKKNDQNEPQIMERRFEVLSPKVVESGVDSHEIYPMIIVDDVLHHVAFLEIVFLQREKATNQRFRLGAITERIDDMILSIEEFLSQRQ
jgi:hypothetical protein